VLGERVADRRSDAVDEWVVHQTARDVDHAVRAGLEDAELGRIGAPANGQARAWPFKKRYG
jgi:hypothetical protein